MGGKAYVRTSEGSTATGAVKKDAKRVEDRLDAGKTVFVYYNNDRDDHAAKNTRRPKEELGDG